jgi:hypothetical protein
VWGQRMGVSMWWGRRRMVEGKILFSFKVPICRSVRRSLRGPLYVFLCMLYSHLYGATFTESVRDDLRKEHSRWVKPTLFLP